VVVARAAWIARTQDTGAPAKDRSTQAIGWVNPTTRS